MNMIIGAHGTGKSTLLKEINNRRPEIYTSDGFSRPIKQVFYLGDYAKQDLINQLTYWRWKEDISKKNCLFGRSIIDSIIYSTILFRGILDINYLQLEFENSYKQVENYFYIPVEFPLVSDGIRPTDLIFQQQIRDAMESFIDKHRIPVIMVTGSVEGRFQIINKYI